MNNTIPTRKRVEFKRSGGICSSSSWSTVILCAATWFLNISMIIIILYFKMSCNWEWSLIICNASLTLPLFNQVLMSILESGTVMYLSARFIDFGFFYDCSIGFWNCSDRMIFIFMFLSLKSYSGVNVWSRPLS